MPAKKTAGKKEHSEKGKKAQEEKKHAAAEKKAAPEAHAKKTEAGKEKRLEHEAKKAKEEIHAGGATKAVEEKGKHLEHKAEKAGAEEKKAEGKKAEEKKAPKIAKSKQVKRLSRLVRAKKRFMFRGRFGQRASRKVSNKKWQKWRKPRGIDIYFNREDGLVPGTGYQVAREIRFVHPSGYRERLVNNMNELLSLEKKKQSVAARLSHAIGKKKRAELLKKADELKIVVLNR